MKFVALCGVFSAVLLAVFPACYMPPPDDVDYEEFLPGELIEVKRIIFDGLEDFRQTGYDEETDSRVFDFQRGGPVGPTFRLTAEKDHTAAMWGAGINVRGLSFLWDNKTSYNQRIKFDKIFSTGYVGKTFHISLWVYNESEDQIWVRLGAFSLSGRIPPSSGVTGTRYEDDPIASSQDIRIGPGWNEVVWVGYRHEDIQVTQLGFEQVQGVYGDSPMQSRLFIDDIFIKVSP